PAGGLPQPAGWFVGSWPVGHSRSQPPNCAGGWEAVAHAATAYGRGTWEYEGATDSQVSAPSGCRRPPAPPRPAVPGASRIYRIPSVQEGPWSPFRPAALLALRFPDRIGLTNLVSPARPRGRAGLTR